MDQDVLLQALDTLGVNQKIVCEDLKENGETKGGRQAVYLAKFHLSETNIAARLRTLITAPKAIRPINPDKAISWVQHQLDITLASKQVEAVKCALTNKVVVITGGPGTGKTTIINAILKIFAKARSFERKSRGAAYQKAKKAYIYLP